MLNQEVQIKCNESDPTVAGLMKPSEKCHPFCDDWFYKMGFSCFVPFLHGAQIYLFSIRNQHSNTSRHAIYVLTAAWDERWDVCL